MRWLVPPDSRYCRVGVSIGPLTTHVFVEGAEPNTPARTDEPAETGRCNSPLRPISSQPRIGTDTYVEGKTCDRPDCTNWARSARVAWSIADPAAKLSRVCGVTDRLIGTPGYRPRPLTRSESA